jgi:PhoPQ-activated pathogenicity-related protein
MEVRNLDTNVRPAIVILFLAAALAGFLALSAHGADALESYVRKADTNFTWKQIRQRETNGFTVTHLDLRSQQWREHLWKHNLQVVRPATVRNPKLAFLFITGSGSGTRYLQLLQTVADQAGVVAAALTDVPNQPLYDGRTEDALIAYTFQKYMETGDSTWPLLFPMAKSAVKAMDAIQAFTASAPGGTVEKFVVSGASKRGWTTWLSAAIDSRVAAIAPMVIDMLNMKAQLAWAQTVYGAQSEKIDDYTHLRLHEHIDEPEMVKLRQCIDPYSYRQRYTMPKLLLLGSNDPYWTVDSLRHYWNDLPEPKLIFQTPNAGHDLAGGKEATKTLAAFVEMIADGHSLPKMEWELSDVSYKKAHAKTKVSEHADSIRLWTATSVDRDFRDDKWASTDLKVSGGSSQAAAEVPTPETGYRAYMLEVQMKSPRGHPYKLSTEARVTPDKVRTAATSASP